MSPVAQSHGPSMSELLAQVAGIGLGGSDVLGGKRHEAGRMGGDSCIH